MKFGEVLKGIRKERGDSLKRLGEKTGVAFLYIVERLELTAIKNGTYEKVKGMLEEVKKKVDKN